MPQYFGQLPQVSQAWTTLGDVQAVQRTAQGVQLFCNDGGACLEVSVLTPNLVRVRLSPGNEFLPRRSWAVTKADEAWQPTRVDIEEIEDAIALQTEQITVQISRYPCRIACFDPEGVPFAQDNDLGMAWSANGIAAWKNIAPNEHFYGFGERTGLLDKLAERKTNWTTDALDYDSLTDEMYQAIPVFLALRPGLCYGIFLNSTFWSQFDLGAEKPGIWQMQTRAPELDYYILYGAQPADILATYTELTGRMPLPPKWALGYHQCRWSYESEDVVYELAQEFRQRHIPCDVIHLDIDYMQGYRVFTWSKKRFPQPKKLISDLKANGFRVVTIVDPGVKYEPEADYAAFDQGMEKDFFVRDATGKLVHGYVWPEKAVFPDFLRPDVRQWWSAQHHVLTEAGVAGIWNDMNEPALDDRPFGDGGNKISFPLDAPQGQPPEQTTHAEAHNLYGSCMAQASYEALKQLRPQERSFVLTRSGFAGIQRWSSVWMGDNQSLWEHLELSLPMLCNMGLSGVPFVGCDIGGFAGNATAELFARWMQVGMLYPLMRGHSAMTTARHEPWVFGDRVERICREYIELRYQLLPYLYSLFWEASTIGAPVLRPLLYHYPNDPHTYALCDQVLLGESLMAAPVCRPGVEYRAVYLPEGVWYDWWTQERYEGATHILAHAPLERMPLYVKAGALIPMQPVMQYVDEHPVTTLTLKVAPGNGEWTLYEDDGHSFEYQTGAWSTTTFRSRQSGDTITVEIAAQQGTWTPPERTIEVELLQPSGRSFHLTKNV
ncbi:MAG: glycoside hydrolase family 31 protein [Leptolyngbyaceae cyanobacterium bins.302]|nr:glycoside hydrolase family 31 protein [Leptolyngbyaceae cyanobacterium bins.302]